MSFMIVDGSFEISWAMISVAEIAVTLSLSSFVSYSNRKTQIVRIEEDLLECSLR